MVVFEAIVVANATSEFEELDAPLPKKCIHYFVNVV